MFRLFKSKQQVRYSTCILESIKNVKSPLFKFNLTVSLGANQFLSHWTIATSKEVDKLANLAWYVRFSQISPLARNNITITVSPVKLNYKNSQLLLIFNCIDLDKSIERCIQPVFETVEKKINRYLGFVDKNTFRYVHTYIDFRATLCFEIQSTRCDNTSQKLSLLRTL